MKHFILVVFAAVAALVFSLDASAQMDKVQVKSYKVTRISPRSFSSVDGSVQLTIVNSGAAFVLSNITGTVYKNGKRFVTGTSKNVTVPKGESVLSISGTATLCPGVSLWEVMKCISFKPSDYTVDAAMRLSVEGGESKLVHAEGLPLGSLLSR